MATMVYTRQLRSSGQHPVGAVSSPARRTRAGERYDLRRSMALQEARGLATTELHSMFGLRQRRPRAAATTEFTTLGITQRRAAKIFDVSERHFRRWRSGDRQIPIGVAILLRLVA